MQLVLLRGWTTLALASLMFLCAGTLTGCRTRANTSVLGTFRMGEKVQVGQLVYTVLESHWKTALTEAGTGRPPQNRYLFIKVSSTNSGTAPATIPTLELMAPDQKTYAELTQGVGEVPNWLGVIRTLQPGHTEQGYVIFDAPIGAYQLMISDGGEPGSEKYAHVDVPLQLE